MYALYAPYNDKWLLLTKDNPRIKNNNLYHWDENMWSEFKSVDAILERMLYFDINCEELIIVSIRINDYSEYLSAFIPDFTNSFECHWTMVHEYQHRS